MNNIYIAIGPNAWGKGATQLEAIKLMRKNVAAANRKYGYIVYECHPDSTVDQCFGGIEYPKGQAPKQVADTRPKK